MRVRFSTLAKSDLMEVKRHVARDKPLAAARLIRSIQKRIGESIAVHPEIGQPCDELAVGLKRFSLGTYVVRIAECVEIARILHGARDIDALFDE